MRALISTAPAYTIAGSTAALIGVVGLAGQPDRGLIPLAIYWTMGSPYFKQRPTLGASLPEDAGV